MNTAKILAAVGAIAILSSAALAQQTPTPQPQTATGQQKGPSGMITEVNRLNSSVAIRQMQDGTVGTSAGGTTERFKVQGVSLDDFHAGDRVTYSATDSGGTKTITKLQKQ